jgi:hypothetical protein
LQTDPSNDLSSDQAKTAMLESKQARLAGR